MWPDIQQALEGKVHRVREIELVLESESDRQRIQILLSELWQLYKWTFNGFKIKGLAEHRNGGPNEFAARVSSPSSA